MFLGRHACRHALHPSHPATLAQFPDHVCISEDLLLAYTSRRFAFDQRRHGSQVPGPLEARRRLAKRRNTALASVAGSGPLDDVGCLFGRDGKSHGFLKWGDVGSSSLGMSVLSMDELVYGGYSYEDGVYPCYTCPICMFIIPLARVLIASVYSRAGWESIWRSGCASRFQRL